jgi:hypothetical protein
MRLTNLHSPSLAASTICGPVYSSAKAPVNEEARIPGGVSLVSGSDGRLKRLAARDILDQHVKFRELDELTRRIEAIEERLDARK